jgi:phospholipid/cholesterol/gamma-HCH transport system ATP-binding protein
VGLENVASRYPPSLGPGAKKRAAIARALVNSPSFLLFDEPTTGLDRVHGGQVNEVIASLKREGLGALVVSHDYRALGHLADRVLQVAEGKGVFFDSPAAFLSEVESRRSKLES